MGMIIIKIKENSGEDDDEPAVSASAGVIRVVIKPIGIRKNNELIAATRESVNAVLWGLI